LILNYCMIKKELVSKHGARCVINKLKEPLSLLEFLRVCRI
jgi:hypothetical protein